MQTQIGHIVFGIDPTNVAFYKDLLGFLGWNAIYEGEGFLGVANDSGASLWFGGATKAVQNDYDGPGMNHLALNTSTLADVDATVAYLAERGVARLFETPRHRPDFSGDPERTYYQVMFESPDRILFEVVYIGPK